MAKKNGRSYPPTPERAAWSSSMKARCRPNPKLRYYHRYAGRGIRVCEQWINSFDSFFQCVGFRPSAQHSLDRYPNNDGNYEPGNVRWATRTEQQNNKQNNALITAFGETKTASQWAHGLGLSVVTITGRLRKGYAPDLCLSDANFRHSSENWKCSRSFNQFISAFGERKTAIQWAKDLGISSSTIRSRLSRGHSPEESLRSGYLPNPGRYLPGSSRNPLQGVTA